jgi:G-patch domain
MSLRDSTRLRLQGSEVNQSIACDEVVEHGPEGAVVAAPHEVSVARKSPTIPPHLPSSHRLAADFPPSTVFSQSTVCHSGPSHDSVAPEWPEVCSWCGCDVLPSQRKQHLQSTVHLFRSKTPAKPRIVTLPESNVGYQMLERLGWCEDAGVGLGRDNQGPIEPVKTTLKRNTRGLGAPPPKGAEDAEAKVTHFPSVSSGVSEKDLDTIRRAVDPLPVKALSKAERAKGKRQRKQLAAEIAAKQARKHHKLGVELSSELPDEYAALFTLS